MIIYGRLIEENNKQGLYKKSCLVKMVAASQAVKKVWDVFKNSVESISIQHTSHIGKFFLCVRVG